MFDFENVKIGVLGLGYVGLPLAVEFGKQIHTTGLDINKARVQELKSGKDSSLEVDPEELVSAALLKFTSEPSDLSACNFYIVTVPTPIDQHKQPDLSPLVGASRMLGKLLKSGDIVVFESTVYPGATEEVCVPLMEEVSGLKFNQDFFV
ncbi:MAG: Vi polysaccharide biosynthesis UDP-N-acetylglucosamine C-6 dehydrogenase TviB, partial [Gammaproteobacteria bacterium]|nr:Vi polysaccharide biosynthesis UDP-N-acetylglucosamine C-6 dehydrogenase TviB [Gammaproteobacteria bacterium]